MKLFKLPVKNEPEVENTFTREHRELIEQYQKTRERLRAIETKAQPKPNKN